MLRVLHITESIPASAGGTSTAFVEMVEALLTQGAACQVHAAIQPVPEGDEARSWIAHHPPGTWHVTGPRGGLLAAGMAASVRALVNSWNPSVVCVHGLWCTDTVAAALHAQAKGVPVVWHPHGMLVRAALRHSPLKKAVFKTLWLARALRHAAAVVFTSENERETSDLAMLGEGTRRVVLPLPVNIDTAEDDLAALRAEGRAALGLHESVPLVSFIGRLHPVKRVELSIAAFAAARACAPDARLVLIGSGDDVYVATLRALAARLGVEGAVVFAGWKNGREKRAILAAADVMILNSEFENFGYAIVESLGLGTPVVCSENLSLAAEMVRAGAGRSAPGEPAALGAALAAVLAMPPHERRAAGVRGRRWVVESFSRQAVGARMVELYRALLA
ncbi:MAG: glycosyltransferase [Phycisphaerales bacterium]